MHRKLALLAWFASAACSHVENAAIAVDLTRIRTHVEILSDDNMEGRGAGYPGEANAAEYVADQFDKIGLKAAGGGYVRPFDYLPVGGVSPFERLTARNVIGVLPGTRRPEEVIVVGAHFDGQGKKGDAAAGRFGEAKAIDDQIWNSASDNAVSVATMIETARALVRGPRPARTIVFVAFSGEENRLNGSFDYVRNPAAPIERHVAMLNLEKLVGHDETELIMASDGSSPRFAAVAEAAAAASGLKVASFYDGVITDTDHFPFILAGVPALVIGTGAYEKIHSPDDEIDTLRLDDLSPRARYVEAFIRSLAGDDEAAPFAADIGAYSGVAGGATTELETAACGLATQGFLVTAVAANSSADRAGLKVGDVVVEVDEKAVSFGEDGANFLENVADIKSGASLSLKCGGNSSQLRLE
jgi:Zn-dependent M28 family amino/carboxypeptidase